MEGKRPMHSLKKKLPPIAYLTPKLSPEQPSLSLLNALNTSEKKSTDVEKSPVKVI